VLSLNGVSISCSTAAPIEILSAGSVDIEAKSGTYNVVTDGRTGTVEEEDDDNAAIIANCDLKLKGKGTLIVSTSYSNGIKSRDDLKVKNLTLKVTAANHALKGNDEVEIESGSLILISTGGDGIKTSASDVSSKGNQKGSVIITGGHIDIYAACDGIDAAYNVEISETESVVLNIFTASYSEYGGSGNTGTTLYLIVPKATYSTSHKYYAYFYNEGDSSGKWVECTYETMVYSGRSASYYGLSYKAPSGYSAVQYYILNSGTTPGSGEYIACTSGETLNTSMNAFLIESVSSKTISGDWAQLSTGSSSNSQKTTYSSKGIKSCNEIIISGGTFTLKCKDDALHANGGDALESGSTGKGSIVINGGTFSIVSADDGMHADSELTINDGYINVTDSYEGIEANVININGGTIYVYADDDGLNACDGSKTPLINITGGYTDVTVPSGDTDGIDSNGNITMSGGYVLVKGGASSGGMAGSIDVDGSIKVTGGAIVALGGICETPANGSVNTYVSSGTSFSAGSYVLKSSDGTEILSFTLSGSYSSCWISSSALTVGKSYVLYKDGSEMLSWTQNSSTEGSSGGMGGFGGGGMGGPGGSMGGGPGR